MFLALYEMELNLEVHVVINKSILGTNVADHHTVMILEWALSVMTSDFENQDICLLSFAATVMEKTLAATFGWVLLTIPHIVSVCLIGTVFSFSFCNFHIFLKYKLPFCICFGDVC